MPSRREQIQSYQYLMQRVVNAFVAGETDPALSPMRRLAGAGYASVMVTVLILAIVGVIGVLRHGGNTTWRNEHVVIIEKETGTRYIYRGGVLYPVANFVSALLALGQDAPTVSVSRESLLGAARGPLIGIAGAPDALPPAGRMLGAPWTLCAQPGTDQAGNATALSWLQVGRSPGSGTSLGTSAFLVRDANSESIYLIWNGHRFLIADYHVLGALDIDQQPRMLVDRGWLDAVPPGQYIGPIGLDNEGSPSNVMPGARVGQVYSVSRGNASTFYLVRADDLLPLTAIEEAIQLADPATAAAYPGAKPHAQQVNTADVAGVPRGGRAPRSDTSPPATVPAMASVNSAMAVCSAYRDATSPVQFLVNVAPGPADQGIATNGSTTTATVDRVVVPAGHGALVRSISSPDSKLGTLYLVTDQGKRYPVPDIQQLSWLGYGAVTPLGLPSSVVSRMPSGPTLDPAVAQRAVSGS